MKLKITKSGNIISNGRGKHLFKPGAALFARLDEAGSEEGVHEGFRILASHVELADPLGFTIPIPKGSLVLRKAFADGARPWIVVTPDQEREELWNRVACVSIGSNASVTLAGNFLVASRDDFNTQFYGLRARWEDHVDPAQIEAHERDMHALEHMHMLPVAVPC